MLALAAMACAAARAETYAGILLDAGCRDRDEANLRRAPQPDIPEAPGGKTPDRRPTKEAVRSGAIEQQTRDAAARMTDSSCAVTAGVRSFALLTDSGRLLALDAGGNTLAAAAVRTVDEGRRMQDGSGPPIKPRVEVTGSVRASQLNATGVTVKSGH